MATYKVTSNHGHDGHDDGHDDGDDDGDDDDDADDGCMSRH